MKSEIIKERIDEIYAIYEQTGKIPNTRSQATFSNGTLIGQWLNNYKKEIENIAWQGNVKAQIIFEKLGWGQFGFSNEEKINEIYAIYEQTGIMPNTNCTERFSNGTLMGPWLHRKKKQVKEWANQGNKEAQIIVKELGWNQEKIDLTDEERINEIYEIYRQTGIMPNTQCTERFSNGTVIGTWLNYKKRLANQGNKEAQIIFEKLGWNQEKIELTDEDRINEIYAIYEQTGKMPNTTCIERFSNGTVIGTWLSNEKNKEKIKKLANQGNEKAIAILNESKTLKKGLIRIAYANVDVLSICLSKGYVLENDVFEFPSYKEYIKRK